MSTHCVLSFDANEQVVIVTFKGSDRECLTWARAVSKGAMQPGLTLVDEETFYADEAENGAMLIAPLAVCEDDTFPGSALVTKRGRWCPERAASPACTWDVSDFAKPGETLYIVYEYGIPLAMCHGGDPYAVFARNDGSTFRVDVLNSRLCKLLVAVVS